MQRKLTAENMKLLTWNIESCNITQTKRDAIIRIIKDYNADIIVLTETNDAMTLGNEYEMFSTPVLKSIAFGVKANRTTVYSKYKNLASIPVNDSDTCICNEFNTSYGNLVVYGTIIGNLGGKGDQFKTSFAEQIQEYKVILKNKALCIAGDLNINFTGYPYPSKEAIKTMQDFCLQNDLVNLTVGIENCVDHIILSKEVIKNHHITIQSWNHDRKLSDHIGVMVEVA